MIVYLIKSALCLAILLAIYHLFLEKEKMHTFNRYYLLLSILFSLTVPQLIVKVTPKPVILEEAINSEETSQLTNNSVLSNTDLFTFDAMDYIKIILLLFYAIGFSIFLYRFIKNLYEIYRKVRLNVTVKSPNAFLVLLKESVIPHSFLQYIFINDIDYKNRHIEEELFTHELTHVKQKHSIDVLFIEVLKVIFWFNPLIYLFKKAIQLNHEFLADESVVNAHKNVAAYQQLLLNKVHWNNNVYLASNLNYLVTKKRLKMMTKNTSKLIRNGKKIALIPIVALLAYSFSTKVEIQEPTLVDEIKEELEKVNALEINYAESEATVNDLIILVYKNKIIELNSKKIQKEKLKTELEAYEATSNIIIASEEMDNQYLVSEIKAICKASGFKSNPIFFIYAGNTNSENKTTKNFNYYNVLESLNLSKSVWSKAISNFKRHKKQYENQLSDYTKKTTINQKKFDYLLRLWNDLLAEHNTIPSDERTSFKITMPIHPKNQKKIRNDHIILLISKDHRILLQNNDRVIKSAYLKKELIQFDKRLSKKADAKVTKVTIVSDVNADEKLVKEVAAILSQMGFKNIVFEKSSTIPNDKIPPPPPTKSKKFYQEVATKEMVREYNTYVQKLNAKPQGEQIIKLKELERIKYIYSLMTPEQKANAEKFPNIPPPPPPPPVVKAPKKETIKVIEVIPPVNKKQGEYMDKSMTYSKNIKAYLKGDKVNNSDLLKQYNELLKRYKTFSKKEKEKFKLKPPPPPPPAKNKN